VKKGGASLRPIAVPILLAALAAALPPTGALADFDADLRRCISDETPPDLGIAACTRQIQSGRYENLAWLYNNRGSAYSAKGEHYRAIQDFDEAIRLDPEFANAYNSLAWLRATGPRHLRDGGAAVRLARAALALIDHASYRDTLAAAYVEAGDAAAAIRQYETIMRVNAGWIESYQDDLAKRGYYTGPIDGDYGPGTRRALAACVEAGCQLGAD
jgi:tetratricopeptide (TPR) repeat protein